MSGINDWFVMEKYSVVLVAAIIILVGFVYFGIEGNGSSMGTQPSGSEKTVFQGIKLKIAFNDKGEAKIFSLAKNNALSKYAVVEGSPIPESDSIVLGGTEAKILSSEGLFGKSGDKINVFFGISPVVQGILKETGTPIDYFHFLSAEEFKQVQAKDGIAFIKMDENGPRLVLTYKKGETQVPTIKLKEGNIADYEEHEIVGKKFFPLVLGAEEAKAMKEEKIFSKLGDSFEMFGKNFIVVGTMEETGSVLDFAHVIPLSEKELG